MSNFMDGYVDVATRLKLAFEKYPDLRIQETAREVIEMPDPTPYTVYGLADFLDCDADTLLNYQTKDSFSVIIARAKHKILTNKVERGLDGKSNPAITKLLLGYNYGIIEPKAESTDDKNININIQYPPENK